MGDYIDGWYASLAAGSNVFCGISTVQGTRFLTIRQKNGYKIYYVEPVSSHEEEVFAKVYVDPLDNGFSKSFLLTEKELLRGELRATSAF